MANPLAVELLASAAHTISGAGASVDIGETRSGLELVLEITEVDGTTPQLTVTIETSPTGAGSWQVVDTFAMAPASGFQEQAFAGCQRYVRVSWEIAGTTPSFTFKVSGQAHQLYASLANLSNHAIAKAALSSISLKERAAGLLRATSEAASAFASSHTMPIVSWGPDVRGFVADLATFFALESRGFSPNRDADQLIVKAADDARLWLRQVAAGRLQPDGMVDSTPEVFEGGSHAVSRPSRWGT